MKHIYFVLLISFFSKSLIAQKNFHKFSIGAGGGITHIRGDLNSAQSKQLLLGNTDYYLTPFVHGGLEAQIGKISGQDPSGERYFQNDFKAIQISGKIHLGQFMSREAGSIAYPYKTLLINTIKGIYVGAGGGIIKNNQTQIFRDPYNKSTLGTNNNKEIYFPLSVGIDNSGFNRKIIAGIRYQGNYVLGDQVDGYYRSGSRNDFYSTITLNVKYKFGPVGIF